MKTTIILRSILSTIASLVGCSPSQSTATKIEPVANDADHNRYFKEGSGLIKPYMRLYDVPEKSASSSKAKAEIARGIALLDAVIVYNTTIGRRGGRLEKATKLWVRPKNHARRLERLTLFNAKMPMLPESMRLNV